MRLVVFFAVCIQAVYLVNADEIIEFGEGSYSYEESLYQEALYSFEENRYAHECAFGGPFVPPVPKDICKAFFKVIDPKDAYLLYERINSLRKIYGNFKKGDLISWFEEDGRGKKSSFETYYTRQSNQHILFINGIKTTYEYFRKHIKYIHQKIAPNANLYGVYNATKNFEKDIFECHLGLCGILTPPAKILKEAILTLFRDKSVENLTIICHSQGAIHTHNALKSLPMEVGRWIKVVAIAPAKFITRDVACNSINAVTVDFVPSLQFFYGFTRENANIKELIAKSDNDGLHSFQSPTYAEFLKNNVR